MSAVEQFKGPPVIVQTATFEAEQEIGGCSASFSSNKTVLLLVTDM